VSTVPSNEKHALDVRVRQPVDAAGVVEEIGVLDAVLVDRLLEVLEPRSELFRRVDRYVDAADRAQRQAVKSDVDESIHGE
jgi:hypothetical protein